MERDKIIKLTNALYKVTDLFPEKETLSISIRKRGNLILSFFVVLSNKDLILSQEEFKTFHLKCKRNVEILFSYFEIAETQNWINVKNFEILKNQYTQMMTDLGKIKIPEKKIVEKEVKKQEKKSEEIILKEEEKQKQNFTLTEIQEKVIKLIQGNGKIKPSDINGLFPGMNPRSIRRELRDLRDRGIVVSNGSGKRTFYEMNSYY